MVELRSGKPPDHELGYILFPPRRPTEPGYARLEVTLREQPSQHHFDPNQVHLLAASENAGASPDVGVGTLKISHPWLGACQWRLCAGQVDLLDRKGKHVDLFTFGGDLIIEKVDEDSTHLSLSSEAPFLLAQSHTSSANLLIQEVEIQIAQLRADWCRAQENFDDCLACVAPFELYRMCLAAILERFEQLPYRDEAVSRLRHVLQDEMTVIGFPISTLTDLKA
jgi:hypothetical protein